MTTVDHDIFYLQDGCGAIDGVLTGLRQDGRPRQRAAAELSRALVTTVRSHRRVHHDTQGPAAIHGQGRAGHRETGAGHRDDDGRQETGRRSVDTRPYHWIPGRPVTAGTLLPTRQCSIYL